MKLNRTLLDTKLRNLLTKQGIDIEPRGTKPNELQLSILQDVQKFQPEAVTIFEASPSGDVSRIFSLGQISNKKFGFVESSSTEMKCYIASENGSSKWELIFVENKEGRFW